MSSLAIVAGLTCCGRVFPSGFTAKRNRMHVIQSGCGFCYIYATVLAVILISQEDISLAQSHGMFGLLVFPQHHNRRYPGAPSSRMHDPIVVPTQYFDFV
jgi:hypothetical protein